ncbi:MAG: SGNH/GDSL hydrolase family protein [Oscillospiraceae bacterium]|nr:SGNH/GDSL hydrolase family protein [Oscillospiraceae bacterium]
MKLAFEQIKSVTTGAVSVYNTEEGVCFDRFTPEQRTAFRDCRDEFYYKSFSCAGIRLRFRTDSQYLSLRAMTYAARARTCFAFDVSVNGTVVDSLDNYTGVPTDGLFVDGTYPTGLMEKEFFLGYGEKSVQILFPWNAKVVLQELRLDDGAQLTPEIPKKKLLAFGDSITMGFDACRPSNRYAGRLADALGVAEYNKAIGGSVFIPAVAACTEELNPDCILVAYGTNDWNMKEKEQLQNDCRLFLENLRGNYSGVPMLVITPIWRKDKDEERPAGSFADVGSYIRQVAENLPDTCVIPGFDLVPHDTRFFSDLRLHPNDEGFAHYFRNLWQRLGENLRKA